MVGQSSVGKSYSIQIMRNKSIMNISVKLEELPTEDKIASLDAKKVISNSFSGISVKNLSPNEKKVYQVASGVLVTEVDQSINNNYDIKKNDIITKINNKIIRNVDDFSNVIKKSKNNSYVNLLVYRQATPLFIALKISK